MLDEEYEDLEERRLDALEQALQVMKNEELTLEKLNEILSTDIKEDSVTKDILFLLFLLTYTDSEQLNIDMTGSPSIGKTYLVNQTLWYFPDEDKHKYAGATPKSFWYDQSRRQVVKRNNHVFEPVDLTIRPEKGDSYEDWQKWYKYKRTWVFLLDLERKITVFTDMPDYRLIKNLRSTLSHDQKFSMYAPVNKDLKTDHIYLKGFFTTIICTTFTHQEPEERDRFFHLCPEWTPQKEKEVLDLIDRRNSDPDFKNKLEFDPLRIWLRNRVEDIKHQEINEIYIPQQLVQQMRDWFNKNYSRRKPKKSRDYPRFYALAKAWALLNFQHRKIEKQNGKKILWCNQTDIDVAQQLYKPLATANEMGLSIEAYNIWIEVVKPLLSDTPVTIKDFTMRYNQVYQRGISSKRLNGFLNCYADIGLFISESQGRGKSRNYYALKTVPSKQEIQQSLDSQGGD